MKACGPENERLRGAGPERAGEFYLGPRCAKSTLEGLPTRSMHRHRGEGHESMRILVTGGAGFIGSHTTGPADRTRATT